MKNLFWKTLILLYCSYLLHAQNSINLTQDDIKNATLMGVLNNYFGCKTWTNGICTQCSTNFYFNHQNICCAVPSSCRIFDIVNQICTQCYPGYDLLNGTCTVTYINTSLDTGCKRWTLGACVQCSYRWFLDKNNKCQQVDNSCMNWTDAGVCQACYSGYQLVNGSCFLFNQVNGSRLCQRWSNGFCLACVDDAYFDENNLCQQVSPTCLSWDKKIGCCLSCYPGYVLTTDGECILSKQAGLEYDGCKHWDQVNQVCTQCSIRWVLDQNGTCIQVSDHCRTWNNDGFCTSCFTGFSLTGGNCSLTLISSPTDAGCKRWDWPTQTCLQCSAQWVMGSDGICKELGGNCNTWDETGVCTVCYNGYTLVNNTCIISAVGPLDLGCKTWNWTSQSCLQCSTRWFMGAGSICNPINDFCSTWDNGTGICLSCYQGYILQNNTCHVLNVFCRTGNADGSCSSCYTGYVLYNLQCIPISKLANIAQYYAACCPQTLETLKKEGRIN